MTAAANLPGLVGNVSALLQQMALFQWKCTVRPSMWTIQPSPTDDFSTFHCKITRFISFDTHLHTVCISDSRTRLILWVVDPLTSDPLALCRRLLWLKLQQPLDLGDIGRHRGLSTMDMNYSSPWTFTWWMNGVGRWDFWPTSCKEACKVQGGRCTCFVSTWQAFLTQKSVCTTYQKLWRSNWDCGNIGILLNDYHGQKNTITYHNV